MNFKMPKEISHYDRQVLALLWQSQSAWAKQDPISAQNALSHARKITQECLSRGFESPTICAIEAELETAPYKQAQLNRQAAALLIAQYPGASDAIAPLFNEQENLKRCSLQLQALQNELAVKQDQKADIIKLEQEKAQLEQVIIGIEYRLRALQYYNSEEELKRIIPVRKSSRDESPQSSSPNNKASFMHHAKVAPTETEKKLASIQAKINEKVTTLIDSNNAKIIATLELEIKKLNEEKQRLASAVATESQK